MDAREISGTLDQMPEIYCAIALCVDNKIDAAQIINSLKQIEISKVKIVKPKYDSIIYLNFAIVNNEHFWY